LIFLIFYLALIQSNRRSNNPSVDAAASFQNMDVLAEPTWMYLRRLAVVSAHKPAAGNWLNRSYGLRKKCQYKWRIELVVMKHFAPFLI
ncbi:hypothetical protein ACFL6Z_12745, partial [Pseudomonadota bacterium]